jgi:hypothetical protein
MLEKKTFCDFESSIAPDCSTWGPLSSVCQFQGWLRSHSAPLNPGKAPPKRFPANTSLVCVECRITIVPVSYICTVVIVQGPGRRNWYLSARGCGCILSSSDHIARLLLAATPKHSSRLARQSHRRRLKRRQHTFRDTPVFFNARFHRHFYPRGSVAIPRPCRHSLRPFLRLDRLHSQ